MELTYLDKILLWRCLVAVIVDISDTPAKSFKIVAMKLNWTYNWTRYTNCANDLVFLPSNRTIGSKKKRKSVLGPTATKCSHHLLEPPANLRLTKPLISVAASMEPLFMYKENVGFRTHPYSFWKPWRQLHWAPAKWHPNSIRVHGVNRAEECWVWCIRSTLASFLKQGQQHGSENNGSPCKRTWTRTCAKTGSQLRCK